MSIRLKLRIALSLLMLFGGVAGAVLSRMGRIATDEPPVVTQLSWAAIWLSGITALVSIDDG